MRKVLAVLLSAMLLFSFAGCASKKTEPEKKPEAAPTPKSGDISFSIIDPAGAPGKIVDLVNRLKTSESTAMAEADDSTYVLVTRGEEPSGGYEAKIDKVTQSVVEGQRAIATVRVIFKDPKPGETVSQALTYPLTLVKLDTGKKPDQITFIIQREKPAGRAAQAGTPESKKTSQVKEQPTEKTTDNIVVDQPKPGATVSSPFLVSGRARVFEASLQVRLLDEKGKTINNKYVTATAGAPEWGKFNTSIQFKTPATPQKATLQVFTVSAKDGTEQDMISIPLTLK